MYNSRLTQTPKGDTITKRISSILTKTLALLAALTLVLTLVACNTRSKYAGTYVCETTYTMTGLFGLVSSSTTETSYMTLGEDGTVKFDSELQDGIIWYPKDNEIRISDGEQDLYSLQISDDGNELYAGDATWVKQ